MQNINSLLEINDVHHSISVPLEAFPKLEDSWSELRKRLRIEWLFAVLYFPQPVSKRGFHFARLSRYIVLGWSLSLYSSRPLLFFELILTIW